MTSDPREAVGEAFDPAAQEAAQALGWQALHAAAARIEPGMTATDGRRIVAEETAARGSERLWHASQVRFGPETTLPFGRAPEREHVLASGDLFFLDIGPVHLGHEADVGLAFSMGPCPLNAALVADSRAVFDATRALWLAEAPDGADLYAHAEAEARARGRLLQAEGASGHRIGDFPHRVHHRGRLKDFPRRPAPGRWILEIHLIDPDRGVGAFFEDLL